MGEAMGRRLGTWNISEEQINKIIELTKGGFSRQKIAREADCCIRTVYKFQKRFNLI